MHLFIEKVLLGRVPHPSEEKLPQLEFERSRLHHWCGFRLIRGVR